MKRLIKVRQVDTITGEVLFETEYFSNWNIYEHKKQFLSMAESFYDKHFNHPELSMQLTVLFPECRKELDLPF